MAPNKDSEAERERSIKAVEAIFERYQKVAATQSFASFDKHLMDTLKIISASSAGTVDFSLFIDERYSNLNGVMHGGAAGVIFDMCTTTALGPLARPGFWDFMGGVTRTLNISYLKAVPANSTVHLHSEVTQVGKTMAMIKGEMRSPDGKILYATAEHHKVNIPTKLEHLKHSVAWDRQWVKDGKDAKL